MRHVLRPVLMLCVIGSPALAERVSCDLSLPCPATATECVNATLALSFVIDRSQFVAAVDVNEPPRQKTTVVTLGEERFGAEPFVIGNVRGFWQDTEAMSDRMFTMQADGSATYSESPSGLQLSGRCEVTP